MDYYDDSLKGWRRTSQSSILVAVGDCDMLSYRRVMNPEALIEQLGHPQAQKRMEAISGLSSALVAGKIPLPKAGEDVNNHIHTIYSFSPYSPAEAVWRSFSAGLRTAGSLHTKVLQHFMLAARASPCDVWEQLG